MLTGAIFIFSTNPSVLLQVPDEESVQVALNCVEIACRSNCVSRLESVGCMDALESVIYQGTSDRLRATASRLWDVYFEEGGEEDEEDAYEAQQGGGGGGLFGSVGSIGGNGVGNTGNTGGMGRGRGAVMPAWAMNQ